SRGWLRTARRIFPPGTPVATSAPRKRRRTIRKRRMSATPREANIRASQAPTGEPTRNAPEFLRRPDCARAPETSASRFAPPQPGLDEPASLKKPDKRDLQIRLRQRISSPQRRRRQHAAGPDIPSRAALKQ